MNRDGLKEIIKKNLGSFYFFYRYLRYRFLLALLFSALVGVMDGFGLAMFLPLLQQVDSQPGHYSAEAMGHLSFLIDGIEYFGLPFTLTTILFIMLGFFLLKGVFKFIEGYYKVINQRYFITRIRYSNIDLLSAYSYKSFVLADSGRIQNTLSGEVERVITAYRSYFSALQYIILVAVYIGYALLANPEFAILVAIGGGLTNFLYKKIYVITKKISREITTKNHTFQGLLIQKVAFFKYLKATGYLAEYGKKLKKNISDIEARARRIGLLSSGLAGMREPVVVTVVICVILFQVNIRGEKLGSLILSLMFFYKSLSYLMSVQNFWNNYLGVVGSLDNMDAFSNELKKGHDPQGKIHFQKLNEKVEVTNVDFNYQQTNILRKVSFTIKKNETVAFVGESGSGKTTLVNLLSGLILPDGGEISVDGMSMKDLNRNTFQQRLGYITQDPVIFNDTVYDNLTLWAPKTPENLERLYDALKKAAIYDFVMSLPDKENSLLGNNGIMVSGGQKQRLSIARELYKDVDFLFLDEATSALDSETEREIQTNIESLKGKYTIIMIAHRLSTVKNADKIILLNKGQIEAVGSFDQLNAASPAFRRMVQFQEF